MYWLLKLPSMKTFSDAERVKVYLFLMKMRVIVIVCNTLFSNFPNRKQVMDELTKLQLCDLTCMRQWQEIPSNIVPIVTGGLQQCMCFSRMLHQVIYLPLTVTFVCEIKMFSLKSIHSVCVSVIYYTSLS